VARSDGPNVLRQWEIIEKLSYQRLRMKTNAKIDLKSGGEGGNLIIEMSHPLSKKSKRAARR